MISIADLPFRNCAAYYKHAQHIMVLESQTWMTILMISGALTYQSHFSRVFSMHGLVCCALRSTQRVLRVITKAVVTDASCMKEINSYFSVTLAIHVKHSQACRVEQNKMKMPGNMSMMNLQEPLFIVFLGGPKHGMVAAVTMLKINWPPCLATINYLHYRERKELVPLSLVKEDTTRPLNFCIL